MRTGSWLGKSQQGQGIGTEMRAAALHLAFTELGAEEAVSGALEHNLASQSISRKLGYQSDGIKRHTVRGVGRTERRLRLTRAAWEHHRTIPVTIDGVARCLPLFGADAA